MNKEVKYQLQIKEEVNTQYIFLNRRIMMAKKKTKSFSDKVFVLSLTKKQIKEIEEATGVDMKKLKKLKLSAKDLAKLIAKHNPDKHDQTVGASV